MNRPNIWSEGREILFEDNHLLVINKPAGLLVQGDATGDEPLSKKAAEYLRFKYKKPGEAFVGVCHRIDRPVSGIVILAKTSKALSRLNDRPDLAEDVLAAKTMIEKEMKRGKGRK